MKYKVILWMNGLVIVFDREGNQVPELQGRWHLFLPKLLAMPEGDVEFSVSQWRDWQFPVTREQLVELAKCLRVGP